MLCRKLVCGALFFLMGTCLLLAEDAEPAPEKPAEDDPKKEHAENREFSLC